jgi:hypothetical protein
MAKHEPTSAEYHQLLEENDALRRELGSKSLGGGNASPGAPCVPANRP